MSEKVLRRGVPQSVCYMRDGYAELRINDTNLAAIGVRHAEADKAREAMNTVPPNEVEVVSGAGEWNTRIVRLVPVLVVRWRGKLACVSDSGVVSIYKGDSEATHTTTVSNWLDAAQAFANKEVVDIISVDGDPNMVRRWA